jgi:peptide/nickel transport system substrate-binding protein
MPLQPGQILNNRYRIAKQIGKGGFGAVYRAWDMRMNGSCVVKENLDTSLEARNQFEREAQILFKLRHPGLPVVFDYFSEPDQGLYLVMDFVEGKNLEEIQQDSGGAINESDAVNWIIQVCEALEYLHGYNPPVIHRDIKPQNIIITPAGKAMLVDFGVAKLYHAQQKTTIGARAITPGYSPPEQYLQTGTDARSDIYSLGATLYTLLSGQVPPESVALSLGESLPSIRDMNPKVNPALEAVVDKAMAPQKNLRFATASEMRSALQAKVIGTEPVSPVVSSIQPPAIKQPVMPAVVPSAMPSTMHVGAAQAIPAKLRKPTNWLAITLGGLGGLIIIGVIAAFFIFPRLLKDTSELATVSTETPKITETTSMTEVAGIVPTALPTMTAKPFSQNGGWLDKIAVSAVSPDVAVTQLKNKEIDLYTDSLDNSYFDAIDATGLEYKKSYGLYYDLTFNPVGPEFPGTGKLNPFSSPKIREAMNWLIDRDHINQQIFMGKAEPKYFALSVDLPDYNNSKEKIDELEAYYAYNFGKASVVITSEMESMGAVKSGGVWTYKGEPVTLIFLIRTDSDGTRKLMGDYVANQLESLGFSVDRQYKKSAEASPIWMGSDPAEGLWHIYTGAWALIGITHNEGSLFQEFYSPNSPQGARLWKAYTPTEEFSTLCDQLAQNQFANNNERQVALERALELSLQDSVRIWLMENRYFIPYNKGIIYASDQVGGFQGSQMWPYTLRFTDQVGGQMNIGMSDLLINPWNPISGSSWSQDLALIRATQSGDTISDPYTGLAWPLRIEKAEVVVREGFLVNQTLNWVGLSFEPEINIPGDAWVDWDAASQTFITADEQYPGGLTANRKVIVYYPADMFQKVTWHDGSPLSPADFVMYLIMMFDRSKPESAIYDEYNTSVYDSFKSDFKAIRIISTDPLIIEYYSDRVVLDAELNIPLLFPSYASGEAPWHVLALSNLAEANGELAYSFEKASALGVEWTNFIGGTSLDILKHKIGEAAAEGYIPYAPTLSKYISADEVAQRYENLTNWYDNHNNFWLGTGPYYLDSCDIEGKQVWLARYTNSSDDLERWIEFAQ